MRLTHLAAILMALAQLAPSAQATRDQTSSRIVTHDNVKPAGRLENGALRLALWAGVGVWHPEGPQGAPRDVDAFGEEGQPLSIPSPLVRVPAATIVHASIRNMLAQPLVIHGFCDRSATCEPVTIASGATREMRFRLDAAGTFHYWATTTGLPVAAREGRDSQLGGAIVVDPPGKSADDRVMVMGLHREGTSAAPATLGVINGRSWPDTERLSYTVGQPVKWRVVNLTASAHAMHLHGFYFNVDTTGNGLRDTVYSEADRRLVVTEFMAPGSTTTLSWVPERAGNWLFHCHMLEHMSPAVVQHTTHAPDAAHDMAGLVMGIHVAGGVERAAPVADSGRRKLQLVVSPDTRHGPVPSYKVDFGDTTPAPLRLDDGVVPGPVMVLTRGEPAAVEILNRLNEPTAIHWHGIELESYDDGVAGFGGTTGNVTPPVVPGGTFTARFTPPRAGTFMYHTHWHNPAQLAAGVYGPLIVVEPGTRFDPETDHIVMVGLDGAFLPNPDEPVVVNGRRKPSPLVLKAGVKNRLRLINISADNVGFTLQLIAGFDPLTWTPIAKDGADLPPTQRKPRPSRQLVTVGEIYDFELEPIAAAPNLWMELRRANGQLMLQWPVRVQ
ncbi:MAG TPA: multicopper oxidase domain-containing protein [Vicinamibacterales bacterium]|nr:multicopper oxidase domain-containing protein [Vicinamibacterales bacterium]